MGEEAWGTLIVVMPFPKWKRNNTPIKVFSKVIFGFDHMAQCSPWGTCFI
jgi:hypothetical protein